MFYNFITKLLDIVDNQNGYIGKEKKAQWAHNKAIADQQAATLRAQIESNERIAKETAEATERAARNSAIGGVLGAALGANTTTTVKKQLLPHERAAAVMSSMEIAQKWNTTREMKESGYSNVAIEYALQGKSHKALYADNEYATLLMKTQARTDMLQNIQTFGIQSGSNPYGVAMSADEFIEMHALKDPKSMLEVDPAVANARQAEFDKWEHEMRISGKGVLVDLYKNPQLAGHGISAMKGKDPLIPKDVAEMLKPIVNDGKGLGDTDWAGAFAAMQRGEENPHTKEIQWAMNEGIIDEYGMPAMDKLMSYIPPNLMESPAFDPRRQLTDAEKAGLLDDYNKFSNIKVDPKLVQERQIGMGVSEKVRLNADGTVAGKMIEGYMTSPTGERIFMTVPNGNLRDWHAKETQMLSGLGPLFPGQLALSTDDEQAGRMGDTRKNQLAKPNTAGLKGPQMTSASNPYGEGHKEPTQTPGTTTTGFVSYAKPGMGTAQAPAATNSGPAGYEGAPLAAGED